MSAYNFFNEYFPGWQVEKFTIISKEHGVAQITDCTVQLKVHLDMNGAEDWRDSDVTVSYIEGVFC